MAHIYGRDYGAEDFASYVGRMSQVAGVERCILSEGKAAGVRAARVYTGSGFEFTTVFDRAMDISLASYNGVALNWVSQVGVAGPTWYEPRLDAWDRTFFGGLVQTCGLRSAGHASELNGEEFGLHGRISATPAENVNVTTRWRGDDYVIEITGRMVQAHAWRENLTMTRTLSTKLGAKAFTLRDEVVNEGPVSSPHTIMYHINPGFPVFSEDSILLWSIERVEGTSEKDFATFTRPGEGRDGGGHFYHKPGRDGCARAAVVNPNLGDGLGLYIAYDNAALPVMVTWKQLKRRVYLIAIEPANCRVNTNKRLADAGLLPILEPGERRIYEIEFGVLSNAQEIASFRALLP